MTLSLKKVFPNASKWSTFIQLIRMPACVGTCVKTEKLVYTNVDDVENNFITPQQISN